MESGQTPVSEGNIVVEAYKLHQHVAYEDNKIFDIAGLILFGHVLGCGFGWASTLR